MGATDNFASFLDPRVRSWTILYQERYHRAVVDRLCGRPEFARHLAIEALAASDLEPVVVDPTQGVVQLMVRDEPLFANGPGAFAALAPIERIEPHRLRACLDVTDRNFDALFGQDQAEISAGCRDALARVGSTRRFRVTTGRRSAARELHIELPAENAWVVADGRSGDDYQLPAGEIASEPIAVDGELDLAGWPIGTLPFGLKYGRLAEGDCTARVEGSVVVAVSGAHVEMCADLDLAFARIPPLRRVVEFGIGTNDGVRRAADRHRLGYVWHEKRRGLHLGLGAELSDFGPSARRRTAHHVDLVLDNASLAPA